MRRNVADLPAETSGGGRWRASNRRGRREDCFGEGREKAQKAQKKHPLPAQAIFRERRRPAGVFDPVRAGGPRSQEAPRLLTGVAQRRLCAPQDASRQRRFVDYNLSLLLTKAIDLESGDQEFTLIEPWPP